MPANNKILKLLSFSSLLSLLVSPACKREERQEPSKKNPPVIVLEKIERKEPSKQSLDDAQRDARHLKTRQERRRLFESDVAKAERAVKSYESAKPVSGQPDTRDHAAYELAKATATYLKQEEFALNRATKGKDQTTVTNKTNEFISLAESRIKEATKRAETMKGWDPAKIEAELKAKPLLPVKQIEVEKPAAQSRGR